MGYLVSHAYLDYRDTFQTEIFKGMGLEITPGIFSFSELIVGIIVTVVLALLVLVKSNYFGLLANTFIVLFGTISSIILVILFELLNYNGLFFMVAVGISITISFLKLENSTTVFPMQLLGSFGTVGSCLMFFIKIFIELDKNPVKAFKVFTFFTGIFGTVVNILAAVYFIKYKSSKFEQTKIECKDKSVISNSNV